MDIVFASSKGSQYKYFKRLSESLKYHCTVVTLSPVFLPILVSNGLTRSSISKGVEFHLNRKKIKLNMALPEWIWVLYKAKSIVKFIWIYSKFYAFFSSNTPKCVGVWNGHRLPEMAITLAAKKCGVRIIYFENGLIANSTTADFNGVNDCNSVSRLASFYRDYYDSKGCVSYAQSKLDVRMPCKSKRNIELRPGLGGVGKYIFVPFQVGFDSQVLLNSKWVQSMEELYEVLVSVLLEIDDPEVCFVLKEHPSDPKKYHSLYERHSRIIFSTENTESLIRRSIGVLTINSSVGMESLLLEKKLIVIGEAFYRIPNLVLAARSTFELTLRVSQLIKGWKPDLKVMRGFTNYIADEYVIPGSWQAQIGSISSEHADKISLRINEELSKSKRCAPKSLKNREVIAI